MKVKNETDGFSISSCSEGFASRQRTLFEQLDVAEKNSKSLLKNGIEPMNTDDTEDHVPLTYDGPSRHPRTKNFRGKESIFKKPQTPSSEKFQISKMPDFKKNPHKWIKYSLNDVTAEDMSDKTNTMTAMAFLKELQKRKESDGTEQNTMETVARITFNKPKVEKQNDEERDEKASFVKSKLVMPEYVVGQKSKAKKEKKLKPLSKGNEIKLSHLECIDED